MDESFEVQSQGQETTVVEGSGEVGTSGVGSSTQQPETSGDSTGAATVTTESAGGEVGTGSIAIDETGNITIADDVIDEHFEGRRDADPRQAVDVKDTTMDGLPKAYTPEELARAFIENKVDQSKIPPEMQNYYKAIMSEQQRRTEILNIDRQAKIQEVIQRPMQKPIPPQPEQAKGLTPEEFSELNKAGQLLAARYLGIKESDFDEFNPNHSNALTLAVNDIRRRAEQIKQDRYQTQVQQYEQQMQHYQQQQLLIRKQTLDGLVQDFQKNPSWKDIDTNFYPQWLNSLDQRTRQSVDSIIAEGNPDRVRQVMAVVFKAYDAAKGNRQTAKKAERVIPLMSSQDSADVRESKGVADTSKLEEMTPEEKAAWFINNKFV